MNLSILNLLNIEKSEIKYEIIQFSDGETHIKFTTEINRKYPVYIKCRIASWNDLMILMQVGDILNRMEVKFSIKIYYLLTMRMDRVISFNEAYSLKIVANMINSLHADTVSIIEPHSSKSLELIKNSIENKTSQYLWKELIDDSTAVVYPDAGAYERYKDEFGSTPILCKKVRDPNTGKLLSFEIENPEDITEKIKKFLVIDDLCDNGGTFIGIANLLSKWDIPREIAITHMVNPNGIKNLSKNYNQVYFTNSYKDWDNLPENVKQIEL